MPRPVWKGNLFFGLVNIPVALFSAQAGESKIDFDMLDARDHAKIRFRRVNERTGKEVPWASIVKGVKVNDSYTVLEAEDFKRAAVKVTKGLEITEFVDGDSISPVYFETPYYLAPGNGADKGYALLRDALKKSKQVGVATLVMHKRQRLAAIMAQDKHLVLITMRFGDEVRSVDEVDAPGPTTAQSAKELELASTLIDAMSTKWNPSRHHDTYREALARLVRQRAKAGGKHLEPLPAEPKAPPRTDLMDLLRQSVEGRGKNAGRHRRSSRQRVHGGQRSRRGKG